MKVKQLKKSIDSKVIIEGINFELNRGEIVGLVGRNGTGKTTLFRTLADHYQADEGSIVINGKSLVEARQNYEEIFYSDTEMTFLSGLTPDKMVLFYKELYPRFDKEKFVGLVEKHQLPRNKPFRKYSKGMKGLLLIILAVSSGANYILLDEPFDGLDILIKKQAIQLVLNEVSLNNRAILISSHNLIELEQIVDRVLLMKDQTIVKAYHLEDMREEAVKLQLVFRGETIPEIVKETGEVLEVRGRVIVALFANYNEAIEVELKSLEPLVMEQLPVSLEDLFTANLADELMIDQPRALV